MRTIWRFGLSLVLVTALLTGCDGCDDESATVVDNEEVSQDPGSSMAGCADEDRDGFPVGLLCEGRVDCDDDDPGRRPGATEECFDGKDNDCDGVIDEGCPECEEGATMDCGSDVGECKMGVNTCRDGVWTGCEGDVSPGTEICNNLDDDCDGEVDEDPESICADGLFCNGAETCVSGRCIGGDAMDCSMLDGPCVRGECGEKDGGFCRAVWLDDGTSCEDGNFCTVNGMCESGSCVTEARDCSGESDVCNDGVCNEVSDVCEKQSVSDGTVCDDDLYCTVDNTCQAGSCQGTMRDCSALVDQCNQAICNEMADECEAMPVTNGTACDDNLYCTLGETCELGNCVGGAPRSCSAAGGSCRTGSCDEVADTCTGDPVPDGTICDDGLYCTVGEACVAGSCVGTNPRDCSSVSDSCNTGACDEQSNVCDPVPVADGTMCEDGAFCTVGDACMTGQCVGSARNCSAVADECNSGMCNEAQDSCEASPVTDGTPCPDGLFCTVNDACFSGVCNRSPRDCTSFDDACNVGTCDEMADACGATPKVDGTSCSDALYCTVGDSCQSGSCSGLPRDCGGSGDQCSDGMCDENQDMCTAVPKADGTACNDSLYCTIQDACQAGLCTGPARNCSGVADQCNAGVCNELALACEAQPVTDGTTCSDGLFCTTNDNCTSGSCGGSARDCSTVANPCNAGICNEVSDSCDRSPVPDGATCDDTLYCTVSDSCVAGACSGSVRDCSASADQCNAGICDEGANTCTSQPFATGTTCDDSLYCTIRDTCTAGTCSGSPRDCSGVADQCTNGLCDESSNSCVGQPVADGTSCSDNLYCTVLDICTNGACAGAPRDCSSASDQCNTGVCDESGDVCIGQSVANGQSCDDSLFCTVSDACQGGSCSGVVRDCSSFGDQCNAGICDESGNTCMAQAVADGTGCSDSLYCTVGDSCQNGTCAGSVRDCSGVADQCNDGVCDEQQGRCETQQRADGSTCDDALYCTILDMCTGGACGGSARDCSSLGDQCQQGVCDESSDSCATQNRADGITCDDGLFCSENETCQAGSCTSGAVLDCSAVTGGDPCFDGVCDESANQCLAVDNGSCDPCAASPPVADPGIDQAVIPNTLVQLNGNGSSDPTNQTLTYSWRIASQPSGSTATLSSTASSIPTLLADVSGTFEVCLVVTDSDGCPSVEECMIITVAPLADLHIELVWFSDSSDIDLHYLAPSGTWFETDKPNCNASKQGTDCFFCVKNPDWGLNGLGLADNNIANDPILDVDNTLGYGPENINQSNLFDASPFTIGVHYWSDQAAPIVGDVDARIRVYVSGVMVFEDTQRISCDDVWEAAEVAVSGNGTVVSVTGVNRQPWQYGGASPSIRCP